MGNDCNNADSIFGNLWLEQQTNQIEHDLIEVEDVDEESDDSADDTCSPEKGDCDPDDQLCEGFLCNLWPASKVVQEFNIDADGEDDSDDHGMLPYYCMADENGECSSRDCCDGLWCKLWSMNCGADDEEDDLNGDHREAIDTFLSAGDNGDDSE